MHALTLADKEKEKMVAMASGSVREMAAAERLALQSKVDEALKEAAVQKTLADGCVRDIRVSIAAWLMMGCMGLVSVARA